MIQHAWIIPALPLLASGVVALWGKRGARMAGSITASAVFFSLVISIKLLTLQLLQPGPKQISVTWLKTAGQLQLEAGMLLDPLTVTMLVVVCLVSLMVQVYSLGYMAEDPGQPRYFSFLSLFTFAMLGLVMANNLVLLYMFWELVGLCSYLLIGFWYHKPEAANAGKKAFVVTRFGDLGFLVGILVLGYFLNTFNLVEIGQAVHDNKLAGPLATLVALLVFCGAVGKSAQFPLHVWLPDAMEGPTPVSALIHAATMVAAGVFLVARVFPVFAASEAAMLTVAYIGGFTAIFAASIGCVQDDIKRVLAYSTVSQLGYMMMGLGCNGYAAGLFHLTTHGAFKALLFLAAGSVIHAVHTNDIWRMGGLFRRMPVTGIALLIGALALSGVPPFSGFFSKEAVLLSAWNAGRMDLVVIGILTTLLTSFYIFRMFFLVFLVGKPRPTTDKTHESPMIMTLPLVVLAVLAALAGFLEPGFNRFIQTSLGAGPAPSHEQFNRIIPVFALLAALFGIFSAYLIYFQNAVSAALLARRFSWIHRLLKNKYYIDEIYQWAIRRILMAAAAGFAWFDRHIVDGAVNGVGFLCRWAGRGLRQVQVGRVQAYVLAFVVGFIVIVVSLLLAHPVVLATIP